MNSLVKLSWLSVKKQVMKSYKIMMMLTVLSSSVVTLVGLNSRSITCYLLSVLLFQYVISIKGKLVAKLRPFVYMQEEYPQSTNPSIIGQKKLCFYLSISPLLFLVSLYIPWLVLILCLAIYYKSFYIIFESLVYKDKKTNYTVHALNRYKPQVAVYVSGLAKVAYQVNQWIPVLEKMPFRCVIVIRSKGVYRGVVNTEIPIFYAKSMRELEYFEEAGVKVCLYPANTQQNVQFLRLFNIKHIFINHGESDKVVNQSKFLMAYDYLFLGGSLANRRLLDAGLPVRENQVRFVGRPQTELLLSRSECTKSINRILYAPTWEGFVEEANYSSVNDLGYKLIQELIKRKDTVVYFKPHPYTGTYGSKNREYLDKIKSLCDGERLLLMGNDSNLYELMNESDLLISDISSVVNEYLYTLKPIVVSNPKGMSRQEYNEKFPTTKAAYLYDDETDINALVDDIIVNDNKRCTRIEVCEDSLGPIEESSITKFEKEISKYL
ncbi:CDP-glycerol glycerophosphotransferase family protein [Cobetia marina]|uniref:CDP-glycerol glycerophosphotransferase family protein n=1 Tax=Cobetia marina TaxID=28258 RepID=UPI0026E3C7BA|nr:CDP-glycerol glycerophosphotransferase family protein [Cobetia marina]MDO6786210.1 CDP-glycerol glycerophosphotransferase family protein [Cobetia marina]